MAVLGRLLVSSAERLDLPDLLSIDSYTAGDFKFFIKSLIDDERPYILRGFEVIDPDQSIGTTGISVKVADSVVLYPGSSAGPFFHGLEEGNTLAQPLIPELRKNSTNYVYLTLSTTDTSSDTRSFWDPDKEGGLGGEFTQDVNTESTLIAEIGVSNSAFPANTIPIAKVVVGVNFISSITDARDLMFRLGTGGITEDPYSRYNFRELPSSTYSRSEPATTMTNGLAPNPFQGGDKNIYTLKEWMDAIMTKIAELGGTTFWYEDVSTYNLVSMFVDSLCSTIYSKGTWTHSDSVAGRVLWSEDIVYKSAHDTRDYIIRGPDSEDLLNEQIAYIELERNEPLNTNDLDVDWINGVNYINGQLSAFENLTVGDWIKKKSDIDPLYLRVEQFWSSTGGGGVPTTAALAQSITLSGNYAGVTETRRGIYCKGIYSGSDIKVGNRNDAAIVASGGNYYWLAMRSDTIQTISDITTTTLTFNVSEGDGETAKCDLVAHGLTDKQQITISGSTNYNGTYTVEVESADVFYIRATSTIDEASVNGYYATITTAQRVSSPGSIVLESANHGFETDQKIIVTGTVNYDGTHTIFVDGNTTFTIPVSSALGNETVGTATLPKINVRTEIGQAKLTQGEIKYVGEVETQNIQLFIGMDNLNQTYPLYSMPTSYNNTLNGMVNYNSSITDNLTDRISRLTAMMADKAQDKTIQLEELYDSVTNTTNGANQEISFTYASGTASLNVVVPGSENYLETIDLITGSPLVLAVNQAAYFEIDRNNSMSINDLSGLTIANIDSVPVSENIFIFALRLSTTDVWLWNSHRASVGTTSGLNYLETIVKQNNNMKLIQGGTWSWNLSTTTLTWSADAYIQIPNLANTRNTIQAGSQGSIADGDVLYVNVNRTGVGVSNLTVNKAQYDSISATDYNNNIVVIARRIGSDVIVGHNCDKLVNGQSMTIDQTSSDQTLSFIGSTGTADSAPNYSTCDENFVTSGDSLTTSISNLDNGLRDQATEDLRLQSETDKNAANIIDIQSDTAPPLKLKQNGTSGVKEITEIIAIADNDASLDQKYFILQDDVGSVAFWYDVDNSGSTIPAGASAASRAIEITTITTGMTRAQVGTATYTAIIADSKFEAGNDNGDGRFTVQSSTIGAKTDGADGDTGFEIRVYQDGVTESLDRVIAIENIRKTLADGTNKTIQPINGAIPTFTSGTVTLPAASGSNITVSSGSPELLTIANDRFKKMIVFIDNNGDLLLSLGTDQTTKALALAETVPMKNGTALGEYIISTVGADVQNVENTDIYQYEGGGGTGSGDGLFNYITNGTFEADLSDWTSTDNTNLAITRITSGQYRGAGSLRITKAASDESGDYVRAGPFTVNGDGGQIIETTFALKTSSGYIDEDIKIGLYSSEYSTTYYPAIATIDGVTNWYEGNRYRLQIPVNGGGGSEGEFYLQFEVNNSNTNGYTFDLDEVRVFNQEPAAQGAFISEWEEFTPEWTGSTTNPTQGTVTSQAFKRRVGSNLEIAYTFSQTVSGTAGSGAYYLTLPDGLNVNTDITISGTPQVYGTGLISLGTGTAIPVTVRHGTSTNKLAIGLHDSTSATSILQSTSTYNFSVSNVRLSIEASIPIAGWQSQQQLATMYSGRNIGATVKLSSTQAVTGDTSQVKVLIDSEIYNGAGAFNSASNRIDILESGLYDLKGQVNLANAAGGTSQCLVYVNGSPKLVSSVAEATGLQVTPNVSVDNYPLNRGDYIELYTRNNVDGTYSIIGGSELYTFLSVKKSNSSSPNFVKEAVQRLKYTATSGTFTTEAALTTFTGQVIDTHNAWDSSTSTMTVKKNGVLRTHVKISPNAAVTLTSTELILARLYINSVQYEAFFIVRNAATFNVQSSFQGVLENIPVVAGDEIQVQFFSSVSFTLNSSSASNSISMTVE